MKLRKVARILLSCVLAGALLTGCGGNNIADNLADNLSGKEIKIGILTHLNSTEESLGEILTNIESETSGAYPVHRPKFFDSLKLMQLGIESGTVEEISLYKSVADYIVATNDKFEIVRHDALNKIEYLFCFAVRKDDAQIKSDIDKVIDEMKADGSLDKLINDYITNVDKGQAPPAIEIPTVDGAEKIKVGVTGDLPPLDFVLPDNTPAGFNTALLAEVAKRLGKNIETVQIDSGARAAALNSNIIDVVFWAVVPFGNDKIPSDIDKPEGVELSKPYFKDNIVQLRLKK